MVLQMQQLENAKIVKMSDSNLKDKINIIFGLIFLFKCKE